MEITKLVSKVLNKSTANEFRPTDAHRRAKAAYWAHFSATGDEPPTEPTGASAAQFSGFSEVSQWWTEVPGFSSWFQNGEEFRQRAEYISHRGLDFLEQLISDPNASTKERLTAAKLALEVAAKFPRSSSSEVPIADKKIQEMDRKQLEEFIAARQKSLRLAPTE